MDRLNVVIAEDQPVQAEAMATMIKTLRPTWRVVAMTTSAAQTMDVMERYQPDLALLDIGLANATSGLEIAKEVVHRCPIIFITGQPGYALNAFDIGAADYLIKPIRQSRFEQALQRIEQILRDLAIRSSPVAGNSLTLSSAARYMQLTSGRRLLWTAVEEVRYLQAETGYTRVFLGTSSGLIRQGLQTVLQRLDRRDFWQIHRSVVINAKFVRDIERDEIGRLTIGLADYSKRLVVAKNQERLFKDDFLG